ncbi:hypothetical protein Ae201684P_000142 [Aphanomyces euteiches]|uniref:SET domain-containing protein n=1 Tax=Aphanomyces euteiches TaxID=100861 RepID=A0A6G0XSC9_9STRA|nr:hypothetical protein Ae201684_001962 [Aphanomyces euteiches]KAH9086720.1 hypothetical protein Ae201684P_000142 [Aphanomyces euteiches]KAH9136914.1 hypothetical protein AeRB84_018115 [Aphanomyces euteiches]
MEAEQRFIAWLNEHGAELDALEIASSLSGSRGVIATRKIAENEVCMKIPSKLFISEASVKEDPVLAPIFAEHPDLFTRDDPLLSTYLVYHFHLAEASFFFPYLSILPEPESILNWNKDDLIQLQDTKLLEAVERRNHEIEDWYTRVSTRLFRLYPDLFNTSSFKPKRFRFAWQTVQARTFGRRLPWTALVPFADMLNHANVATRYDYDIDGNSLFQWRSSQSHNAGDQVFNSYGRRPNQHLLLDYGFALPQNEWDYVDFDISLMEYILPKPERRRLFLDAHIMPSPSKLRLVPDTTLDEVLPFYRCACLTEVTQDTSLLEVQDTAVETQSLYLLRDQLTSHLTTYVTTIEEDAFLLSDNNVQGNLRTAIQYRWHQKHILHRIIGLANSKLCPEATTPME